MNLTSLFLNGIQSGNKIKLKQTSIFFTFGILFSVILINSVFPPAFADGPPEPITDLVAIPANGEVHLVWSAPFDNGVPIQNYKVIMWKTGTDVFTTFPNLSTVTRSVATGLTNDVSYNFKVIAKNSRGESPDSNIVSAKPTSSQTLLPPDFISDLKATRGDGKVFLSWTPPYNGGTAITSYKVSYWEVGSGNFKTKTLEKNANNAQITNLINEVPYRFKIVANNALGPGPDSNVVSATPSTSSVAKVPNEVRGVNAIASDGQVLLTWIKPSDNGAPITNYKIIVSETGATAFTTFPTNGPDTQKTITGLTNGIKYNFKVIAINSIGEGKASGSISATPAKKVSVAVTNLRVTAGDGKAYLSWAVAGENIDQVTGFRVREYQSSSNSFEAYDILGKTTQTTISGLTNGVSYGFSVVAVTKDGLGPSSSIVNVIPKKSSVVAAGAPSAVSDLKATPENNQVKLTWSTPNSNGNQITGYQIQQFKRGDTSFITIQKSGALTNAIIPGLTNGVTYDFKVLAVNAVGIGPVSNTASSTPGSTESKISIPSWIKTNAKWWSENKISDREYVGAIEYLINVGIIKLK